MLQFNAERHEYTVNGVIIPSVTTVLSSILGGPPDTHNVRAAAERGTIVHETVALDLAGDLDEESVDPQVQPYLAAARLFCRECEFKPMIWEARLYSAAHGFAGTLDCYGDGIVLDWKAGAKRPQYALQTCAYQILAEESGLPVKRRMVVYLKDTGAYEVELHKNASDRADFLALLRVFRLKERFSV